MRTSDESPVEEPMFLPADQGLRGTITVPGDKSISHRAVMLAAVSDGSVTVTGFLRSADTLSTVQAVRALGVEVEDTGDDLVVRGLGWEGLQEPANVIDVGNSGTTLRLLPGLIASRDFLCVLTGDASIRQRPMARVIKPLAEMGVQVGGREGDTLPPLFMRGGPLRSMRHVLPVASAQVKSCILLAGLSADGETVVQEPGGSRDHTERMIRYAGGTVDRDGPLLGPGTITVSPLPSFTLPPISVPGDFSSAAFFLTAALLTPGSEVTVQSVCLNPTRLGLVDALLRMGADIRVAEAGSDGLEPVGDITAKYSQLSGTDVEPREVPAMIDELPLLLLCAAKASGTTRLRGAEELRVKESDRLDAMATTLRGLDVKVIEHTDGLEVTGRPDGWSEGMVESRGDHRLAMIGAVAGVASRKGVTVRGMDCVTVSFPDFQQSLARLGGTCVSSASASAPDPGKRS